MTRHFGFTIIELLITMVVISILLTLGVVGMQNVQANARDAERQSDVETIARGLEGYYSKGNPYVLNPPTGYETRGTYPGTNQFQHIFGNSRCAPAIPAPESNYYTACHVPGGYYGEVFPGVSVAAMTSPLATSLDFASTYNQSPAQIQALLDAGAYVYQPMNATGSGNCVNSCPKFILMYKKETTQTTITIKSKHQ